MTNTKKKLCISLLTLVVTICVLLSSTYAWFTDSVSNTGNRIQAGTLDIGLEQYINKEWVDVGDVTGKDNTPVFNYDKWEPGYTDMVVLRISNKESNLSLKYRLFLSVDSLSIYDTTNITDVIEVYTKIVDKETAESAFENIDSFNDVKTNLEYVATAREIIRSSDNYDYLNDGDNFYNIKDGVVHGVILPEGGDTTNIDDAVVEEAYAIVALHMDEDAGNEYQNKSQTFDILLTAGQYTYEKDGFNSNDYDAKADFGVVTCLAENSQIMLNDGTTKLIQDINFNDDLLTWNFMTGQLESHKCYLITKHNNVDSTLITLTFENGKQLEVVDAQCIFDLDLKEYAYINKYYAKEYIGDEFMFIENGLVESSKLVDFKVENKKTNSYEICTEQAINFIANNIVTIEPESYGFNIFEINENLKITEESKNALIDQYGLYTYDDFPDLTHETFDAIGVRYFKIIMESYGVDVDYLRDYYKEHNVH